MRYILKEKEYMQITKNDDSIVNITCDYTYKHFIENENNTIDNFISERKNQYKSNIIYKDSNWEIKGIHVIDYYKKKIRDYNGSNKHEDIKTDSNPLIFDDIKTIEKCCELIEVDDTFN